MQRLIDAVEYGADFFVEEITIRAIVFDNSDDVTVWATTIFDQQLYFFHLGLPFASLDVILRQAGPRAGELQEEVADALAHAPRPCLIEYTSEDRVPVELPGLALKLSFTYPADEDEFEADEDDSEEDGDDSAERAAADNVFYLEGIYRRLDA
ncbi:hypothetical protein F0P96_08535 [Hymenobacter busanensis]|uniref:Uncharacterized protein n=1 Tax=Hymenobacter busanensis TaxID=2607656 RepID=A0A7L4ZXS0_9BACT|nr:hypothetical protein [Hymenobacter busanensis]KAA9333022.1 hypothetical protein F0P96_08535 [Hymenobacter busanensis]QHJ08304.1 hypothetical protein GUY19_13795 [Hymenobacter busanensis]